MARKILLADDSVTAQNMGRKILSDAGYDVVTVNNGSAALKRVVEQKPDLIVLDVYMPGYSGLEVCQRLKDSPDTEAIPILLTVGKLEPFKPEEARRVRAEAYIVKPFEASELLSALTRLEDQIVPGHGKGNGKSEGHGDSETGWKNRLRFPAKKKKEEPEPEAEIVAKSKSQDAQADKSSSAVSMVPEIPRDITPEELDALSALAAKLDGESSQNAASEGKTSPEAPPAAAEAPAPAVESKPAAAVPAQPAAAAADTKPFEVVPVRVETLAEAEAAPIDQNDEPIFAAPVTASEAASSNATKPKEESAEQVSSAPAAPPEVPAKAEETKAPAGAESEKNAVSLDAPKVEIASTTVGEQAKEERETPAPSEAELAEALRLLTPATAEASPAGTSVVAAKEAGTDVSAPARWTAVPVALDPEEAASSLEGEMFQTLARSVETSATEKSSAGTGSAPATSVQAQSVEATGDQAGEEEPAGVTFADAVLRNDEPVTIAQPETKSSAEAILPEAVGTTNSTNTVAGGGEAMGNEHGKNGKSNWHQIRTAAPAAKDVVEAAKQADSEEPLKAMAAAADGSRLTPTDPTAIANIVDSVLADLRPKIVEEISKKLSGK